MCVISSIFCHRLQYKIKLSWSFVLGKLLKVMTHLGFGYPAYYHVKEDKLDPRAKKRVFLEFKEESKTTKYGTRKTRKLF